MPELIFSNLANNEEKKFLLESLGYEIDCNDFVLDGKTKKLHICPITKKPVKLENASVLPGSTVIINTNAMTLSEYFARYLKEEKEG